MRTLTGRNNQDSDYHELYPYSINLYETNASAVYDVIAEEYTNPFEPLGNQKLIHLSSGVEVADDIANSVLSLPKVGKELYKEFRVSRLLSTSVSFHKALTRVKRPSFSDTLKGKQTKKKQKGDVTVSKDILGQLHALSIKEGTAIDYREALKYPLSKIPLSLANSDGTMRKTAKPNLKSTFIDDSEFTTSLNATGTLIVDLVALFHQLVKIPETYVKVCNSIISMVSKTIDHVERVDFVADCYTVNISPIKRGEHIQ